jgi:hypothetical protein
MQKTMIFPKRLITKKVIVSVILFLALVNTDLMSQDTTRADTAKPWTTGGLVSVYFTQSKYDNWSAGGEDALMLNSALKLFARYKKDRLSWENSFDGVYGFIKNDDYNHRKSDDRLELSTKFGYKASKQWYYGAAFTVKTQFYEGFDYSKDTMVQVSDFLTPAYVFISLGMDYKLSDIFSALMAPISGKLTYVNDTAFSELYGVDSGESSRYELGALIRLQYQQDIVENINVFSKLELFSNYFDKPEHIDVNWEVNVIAKIYKALNVSVNTQLIYDFDTKPADKDAARVQFKEVLGIGLSYKF